MSFISPVSQNSDELDEIIELLKSKNVITEVELSIGLKQKMNDRAAIRLEVQAERARMEAEQSKGGAK